jgi:hypothetical protein
MLTVLLVVLIVAAFVVVAMRIFAAPRDTPEPRSDDDVTRHTGRPRRP